MNPTLPGKFHSARIIWQTISLLALLAASCGSGDILEAGTTLPISGSTGPPPADAVAPGFNTLRRNGCDNPPPDQFEVSEWYEWLPIQLLVEEANVAIQGTVVSVSEPRISTTTRDAPLGGPDLTYFRILTIQVNEDQSWTKNAARQLESEVQVLMIGAGVGVDPEDLCFGRDGAQDDREIALRTGDSVVVIGELRSGFPIIGLTDDPVVFLTSGVAGIWRVAEDGTTQSAIVGYSVELEMLSARLRNEFEASEAGETLGIDDSLSVEPVDQEPPRPSTTAPPPPGVDAPDSPTIAPPTEP